MSPLSICPATVPQKWKRFRHRARRFLLLQKGQLICSDLTMLIAQTLNHGQHAHTIGG